MADGFLAQTAAMYRRVGGIEQRVVHLEESEARSAAQRDLLAWLDERVNSLVGSMVKIESRLDIMLREDD